MLLLETAIRVARRRGDRVEALHVHHGLSPHADQWADFCRAACAARGVTCRVVAVRPVRRGGESLEAKAREARYAALSSLCAQAGSHVLLTAHHGDDQAETVLLNLARGAGVAGLQGIAERRSLGSLLVLRPFLRFSAAEIRATLRTLGATWIEDESNRNEQFRRNALRHRLLPELEALVPGARANLGRAAGQAALAQQVLDERGLDDLSNLAADASGFQVAGLRALSRPRAINALRTWFRHYRGHAPSARFIEALLGQIGSPSPSARLVLQHDAERFVLERGRLSARALASSAEPPPLTALRWDGESVLEVPAWGGRIRFENGSSRGLPAAWLRSATLTLRARTGGERLRLARDRPSRSLKNLYQESGIPLIKRRRLPLLYADDSLLWAAGLGLDVRMLSDDPSEGFTLHWESLDERDPERDPGARAAGS
jgi:tRNA(Ile)-lysidine synthase